MNEFVIWTCYYMLFGVSVWTLCVIFQGKATRERQIRDYPLRTRITATFLWTFFWPLFGALLAYCLFRGWWTSFKYRHLLKD